MSTYRLVDCLRFKSLKRGLEITPNNLLSTVPGCGLAGAMGATGSTFAPPTSLGFRAGATVIDESREGDGVFWASAPSPATTRQQSRTEAPARDVFSGVTRCLLVAVAVYCETQIVRPRVTDIDLNTFLRASRADLDG